MAEPNTETSVAGKHPPGSKYGAAEEIAAILNGEPKEEKEEVEKTEPEAGEVEEVEAGPEEEAEIQEPSEEEAISEDAEAADEEETFILRIGDEERELTPDDIIQAVTAREEAQRESGKNEQAYQELVERLEQAESIRQSYASRLEQFVQTDDPRPKLSEFDGDTDEHAEAMDSWYARKDARDQAARELEQENQRTQELQRQAYQRHMAQEAAALKRAAPHLANQKALDELSGWLVKDFGFQPQEVNLLADHRYVRLAEYAKKGYSLEQSKPKVMKKVKSKPQVVRTGTPRTKQEVREAGIAGKMATLKKTGSRRDAVPIIAEFLKDGNTN